MLDLSENGARFAFQRVAETFVVGVGELPCLIFEIQVAQVFVDRVLTFLQVGNTALIFRSFSTYGCKYIQKKAEGQQHRCNGNHSLVSSRARRRNSVSSMSERFCAPTGATLNFHLRTMTVTSVSP